LYGRCSAANCPLPNTDTRSSTASPLSATVASTTSTPRSRSAGTSVATTFSIPP
jgi:hypothetical protein